MNKLSTLLKSLSKRELTDFAQFMQNPLVNRQEDVQELFQFWVKTNRRFTKEIGFAHIYPGKTFNVSNWHLLTSRLFKLAEQFLIANELSKDKVLQKTLLAKSYRKKQILPHFQSTINSTRNVLQKTTIQNADWLHQKYAIEYHYYDYIASHNRKERTNLQSVNNLLDQYYISNKLKNACLAISRKTINQEDYQIEFVNDALQKIAQRPDLLEVPSIAIYYYCYQAITEASNEEWFAKLRASILLHSKKFEPSEKRDIMFLAINYCIRKLNTGAEFYVRETFELYRLSFAEGYLLEDKIIPESMYFNIVSLAMKNNAYEWAENFVKTNQQFLKPVFQEPLYNYSIGLLNYEQGNLTQSMHSLALVVTNISFLLLATKSLQIKIYYELQETEALESLLESFRVYLQRRKDLGYRKENFENLITFVRRLINIPYKDKTAKVTLIKDVNAAEIFSEKEWLLRQIK